MQYFRIANESTSINPFGLRIICHSAVVWYSVSTIVWGVSMKHIKMPCPATLLNLTDHRWNHMYYHKKLNHYLWISVSLVSKKKHSHKYFNADHTLAICKVSSFKKCSALSILKNLSDTHLFPTTWKFISLEMLSFLLLLHLLCLFRTFIDTVLHYSLLL